MKFFLTLILLCYANYLFAQKPLIDSVAYKRWPSLGPPTISNDGKYLMYNLQNIPIGSKTLVVQSTDGKWKKEFIGGLSGGYTSFKGKYLWFLRNDSVGALLLGTDNIKYIPKVSSFSFQKVKDNEYLIYQLENKEKMLVVKNLKTQKERSFTEVDSWNFKENLLVLFKSNRNNDKQHSMSLLDLNTGKITEIWKGAPVENLVLDVKHYQLAFKAGDSVWYCRFSSGRPICIMHKDSAGFDKGFSLGDLDSFSKDGKLLFTSLIEKKNIKLNKGAVKIWSYRDVKLQTAQERESNNQRYLAVINISNFKILRLQEDSKEYVEFPRADDSADSIALVKYLDLDEPWNIRYKINSSLTFLKSGKRKMLKFLDNIDGVRFSPFGKYLIYFDEAQQNYFSYEISTEIIRNLTKDLKVSWNSLDSDDQYSHGPRGLVSECWSKNDAFIFVYDQFDIWKLDPSNRVKPLNITNNFGKRNNTVFTYLFDSNAGDIIKKDEKLYLTAFNKENKNNGFFLKQVNLVGDPKLLKMGAYLYHTTSPYVPNGSNFSPVKAKNSETYIVRSMSPTDAPNYFSTTDFKAFIRLSNLQPQKEYNWYTTELHSWKSLDGRTLQGTLYRPENFDPKKKYPVIIHFYERKSDGLNAFIKPESLGGLMNINIPTYVSNGYLIFCPDIYYKIGDPMQGTYDAVVSAANYISGLSFTDANKMGIQGGSFGGFQTNYLVTHTNLFAAATSSSGVADWISSYGNLISEETSQQSYYETGQARIGGSLWEKPAAYIKNSPIFQIDKVTTPLLIMHTVNDGICLYQNALEFFNGLRRMGKRAWMLVYPDEDHILRFKTNSNDFSFRMMQFFDHYLKDKPAPIWMTRGISAENSGIENGYNYDIEIQTPGLGLLNPVEQTKVDSLMTIKPITITLK